MYSQIIDNKRFINDKIQLDDINYVNNKKINIIDTIEVKNKHLYRWDRISYEAYGNENYGDLLYKFNEFDHPYEHKIGDIVLIPELNSLQKNIIYDSYDNEWIEFDINILPIKNNVDDRRIKYLQKKNNIPTKSTFKPIKNNIDNSIIIAE